MATNDRIETRQFMILCALRYALGRQTYIVGMVTEEIQRLWNQLDPNDQNAIELDVRHQVDLTPSNDADLLRLLSFIQERRANPVV